VPAPILSLRSLVTELRTQEGRFNAVDGVSFDLHAGEVLGIVGESGCGKSMTALSILGLVPSPPGRIVAGEVWFEGRDLVRLPERELRRVRGAAISMIFQEPMTSLNPVFTVGEQILETLRHHERIGRRAARARAVELLARVGIPSPAERLDAYPHELSGGMKQRVMIAMALLCEPRLLIADEPTTALDVTVQAQILHLMRELQRRTGAALLFITHDMGVIAQMCDAVAVMYAGRVVERRPVVSLFEGARHPYTRALLDSMPRKGVAPKVLLPTIEGSVPSLLEPPRGCRFAGRCRHHRGLAEVARRRCREHDPPLVPDADGWVACHHPLGGASA
jgi:oligopeptide/dipeptide ABC transporter ATP-binding protein